MSHCDGQDKLVAVWGEGERRERADDEDPKAIINQQMLGRVRLKERVGTRNAMR